MQWVEGVVKWGWVVEWVSKLNLSGEGECSRLDSVLGVCDIVGVFRADDGIEWVMNHPLTLG